MALIITRLFKKVYLHCYYYYQVLCILIFQYFYQPFDHIFIQKLQTSSLTSGSSTQVLKGCRHLSPIRQWLGIQSQLQAPGLIISIRLLIFTIVFIFYNFCKTLFTHLLYTFKMVGNNWSTFIKSISLNASIRKWNFP